jgi:hypothetical protein
LVFEYHEFNVLKLQEGLTLNVILLILASGEVLEFKSSVFTLKSYFPLFSIVIQENDFSIVVQENTNSQLPLFTFIK